MKTEDTLEKETQKFANQNMINLPSTVTFFPSLKAMVTMVEEQLATNNLFPLSEFNKDSCSRKLWMELKPVVGFTETTKGKKDLPD